MSLAEFLERFGPLLEASGAAPHWGSVLFELTANLAGWQAHHSPSTTLTGPDPVYDDLGEVLEQHLGDVALATALSSRTFVRRMARSEYGPSWTIFDGPFATFLEQAGVVRTGYDVLRQSDRIRDELLGRVWMARHSGAG